MSGHTASHPSPTPAQSKRPADRPLPAPLRFLLAAATILVGLLTYIFCLFTLLLIGIMIAFHAAMILPGLRVGMAGTFARSVALQFRLGQFVLRAIRIQQAVDYHILLEKEEAPGLFALIERCAERVSLAAPDEVRLEMELNAWVRLKGKRKGRGHTTLGVGFDLLTLLSQKEFETVILHELGHAKLVQRGIVGWVNIAVRRISQLAYALDAVEHSVKSQKGTFLTASFCAFFVRHLARMANWLLAAYYRQDEFEADRVAAEVCGPSVYRQALVSVHLAAPLSAELTWRDRLIAVQRGDDLPAWLREKLTPAGEEQRAQLERKALEHERSHAYETHPALADRLAALPAGDPSIGSSPPALNLLAEPHKTAERLLEEVERLIGEEERKETGLLREGLKQNPRKRARTTAQKAGVYVLAAGIFLCLVNVLFLFAEAETAETKVTLALLAVAATAGGVFLMRTKGYEERLLLPIPPFEEWDRAMRAAFDVEDVVTWAESAKPRLADHPAPSGLSRRDSAAYWGGVAYEALNDGDYPLAWQAAREGMNDYPDSLECLLALGISLSALRQVENAEHALGSALTRYGLGPSVSWGLAWGFAALGEWARAEGYLQDSLERRPEEPTLWAVLGACQWRRDKTHEAARSLQRALELAPGDVRARIYLSRVLAEAGRPREAREALAGITAETTDDYDLLISLVHVALLLKDGPEAGRAITRMEEAHPGAKSMIDVAHAYADSDRIDDALATLERLIATDYYPEAIVLRSMLLYNRDEDKDAARARLLSAIDMTRPVGGGGKGADEFLAPVAQMLSHFREPVSGSRKWLGQVMVNERGIYRRFFVMGFSQGKEPPAEHLQEMLAAMYPPSSFAGPRPAITWERAPDHKVVDGSVPLGIYYIQATPVTD